MNEPTLRESAEEKDIEIYDKLLKDGVVKNEQDREILKTENGILTEMKDILNYGFPGTDADGKPIRMSAADEAKLIKDIADKERDIRQLERDINTLFTDNGNLKKIIRSIKENIQENIILSYNIIKQSMIIFKNTERTF